MHIDLPTARLRPWRSDDAPSLARHANNRNVWRNLGDAFPHPYTLDDAREFIARAPEIPGAAFAIEVGGEACGGIGVHPQTDIERLSAQMGYWLGEAYWGRGIVTDAVRAVASYAFESLGMERVYARVVEWNPASARVLEKAGFRLEGRLRRAAFKDNQLVDMLLYALVRDDLASKD